MTDREKCDIAQVTVTSSSKGSGTYLYMASEMFEKGERGHAVDIYSLVCLYFTVSADGLCGQVSTLKSL